jgi:L-rhamnonate dehydratase
LIGDTEVVAVEVAVAPIGGSWLTDTVIANPMSQYPTYRARRQSWLGRQSAGVVIARLAGGTEGYGFIGGGHGAAAREAVVAQIAPLVVGKSCFQTSLVSEQLRRSTMHWGQGGLAQDIASGVDIALWDLKGKLSGLPVYDLLGGAASDSLPAYLTALDTSAMGSFGITDVKLGMPHGPVDGEPGMRQNEAIVAAAREAVGPDGMLALDCYMAWSVPYAVEMARRLRDYRIEWIEEPVLPDDLGGYRRIRDSVDCMVTGGEHVYTLRGFERLIVDGAVDIVQPDIYRMGGPTVVMQVAALARAHGRQLICHAGGMPTYHTLLACGPDLSPRCEFLDITGGGRAPWVLQGEPRPIDGRVALGRSPGFGYELDADVFEFGTDVAPIW